MECHTRPDSVEASAAIAEPPVYRIRDWNRNYENNRSRELKNMLWIPLKVKLSSGGYTHLLDHKDGAAHFGLWIGLLELAATCETRGTLTRGGGLPHTCESIARTLRMKTRIVKEGLARLISKEIAWLECVPAAAIRQSADGAAAVLPQQPAVRVRPQVGSKGSEGKESGTQNTEPLARTSPPPAVGAELVPALVKTGPFDEFWRRYPHKTNKNAASSAWRATVKDGDEMLVFDMLDRYARSDLWERQIVKEPAKWLWDGHNSRWTDEPAPTKAKSDSNRLLTQALLRKAERMARI